VLALADGHGSPLCVRSKIGADLAVEAATLLLSDFHRQHLGDEKGRLKPVAEEQIPKELILRWRETVTRHMAANPLAAGEPESLEKKLGVAARRALDDNPFLAYGSTVMCALATPSFVLYLQLGDGDLLIVSSSGETKRPWPRDPRLLGVETTSLCMPMAEREVRLGFLKVSKNFPEMLLLSTDGYSNSFREEAGFLNVGRDILEVIRTEGIEKVSAQLESWLTEATESGSGDDISLGILCRKHESSPPGLLSTGAN
jgi:hypothetical protein